MSSILHQVVKLFEVILLGTLLGVSINRPSPHTYSSDILNEFFGG